MDKSELKPCLGGIVFEPLGHTYTAPDGHRLKGVTTLMAEHGLGPDYGRVRKDVLAKKAAHGTDSHRQLEAYDTGDLVILSEELEAYKAAMKAAGLRVIASEYLVSNGLTVASSIDKVCDDGSLCDVKTTAKFEEGPVSWQLSIYAYLFERQNPGVRVPSLWCIWFSSPKDCRIIEVKRHDDAEIDRLLYCDMTGEWFQPDPVALPERLRDTLPELVKAERSIAQLEAALKEAKGKRQEMYAMLFDFMEENEIKTFDFADGRITRVDPYDRKTFDSGWLMKNMPALWSQHLKSATIAGTVRVTLSDEYCD